MRTPAKAKLAVKSRELAEAMAEEWQTQGDEIDLADLPLTRLAGTAIDLIEPRRAQIIAEIAKYAATDLLCYRAENPPELVRANTRPGKDISIGQARVTRPSRAAGVSPLEQPPETLQAYAAAVAAYEAMILAAI